MTQEEWRLFQSAKFFSGSDLDRASGFIHLSAEQQVRGTLETYFHGRKDLVLVILDPQKLKIHQLKWEISRDNQKFPHYYADLPLGAVHRVFDLELQQNGTHIIPL